MPSPLVSTRAWQVYAVAVTAAALIFLAWGIIARAGGIFYTLDDPYIHLAVAETVLRGGYGINSGEFASPSSSILYPLLLAALLALGLGTLAPIVLTAGAALWSAWLIGGVLGAHAIRPDSLLSQIAAVALVPLALLAMNIFALPFTGMEHSLHVLTVCFVVVGLTQLREGQRTPALLVAGIVLAPLLRFEGAAVSLAGLLVLAWSGRLGALALSASLLGAGLGGFYATMTALGLPPLPSSVMVKSTVSSAAVDTGVMASLVEVVRGVSRSMFDARALLLAVAALVIWFAALVPSARRDRGAALAFVAVVGLSGHVAAGQYGWFSRYEVYAVTLALLSLVVLFSERLRAPVDREVLRVLGLGAIVALVANFYVFTMLSVPAAAHSIFAQQYQMHRFATDFFPYPVAVNDLGWVAFRNDGFVLDLWGLGSEEARIARSRPDFGPDAMQTLVAGRDIAYAMIYDAWFPAGVPETWCRIAELRTPRVTAASDRVAFYLIDAARENEMLRALASFETTLPPDVALSVAGCPAAQ